MSRSARLLDLIQALRRRRRPVPASALAAELNVSLRTIYRDVATLIAHGAPIEGEAGLGYVLKPGFFLPPLMFTEDETDALILGLRLVAERGDAELERTAGDALAKISAVLPPAISAAPLIGSQHMNSTDFAPRLVILYVDDPLASSDFYAGLLRQQPIETSPTFAMFPLASGMRLGLWSRHTVEPGSRAVGGGGEIAFTAADVDAVHADWTGRGLRIEQPPTDMDFGRTFVALDPDGHRLRVYAPAPQ